MTATKRDHPDVYWKATLTPDEYRIMREKGTEPAFTGKHVDNHANGVYHCQACGQELFASDTKFESGSGWPSFTDPVNAQHIELHEDMTFGMRRVEVSCNNCGSHLGHLFDDGPLDKGGKRYCINSACLGFDPQE